MHRAPTRDPHGLLAALIVLASGIAGPIVATIFVFAWAKWSRTPHADLGLVRPRHWGLTLLSGIALGIVFKLAMKSLVMPLFGVPPENATYHYLLGNTAAIPGMLFAILVGAAFGEEVFYRGFMLDRFSAWLSAWLDPTRWARVAAVVISSGLFAAAHLPAQGRPGAIQAGVVGLVLGGLVAWRRELALAMVIHGAFDLTALLLIYKGWEIPVAEFFFGTP